MSPVISLSQLAADLSAAVLFCTRLPVPGAATITGTDIARAGWALPIAGAIVGLIAAVVYWLARLADVPPFPAAGLTVVATLLVTGCLHEDGLADVADSFGASTRERKLEIMRDSKIGTYGVCALFMSLLLRSAALAIIADPALAASVLVAAHMAARAGMPLFMRLVPPARDDGLSVGVGTPPRARDGRGADRHRRAWYRAWARRGRLRARADRGRVRIFGVAMHEAHRRPDRRCPGRARANRRDHRPACGGGKYGRMILSAADTRRASARARALW